MNTNELEIITQGLNDLVGGIQKDFNNLVTTFITMTDQTPGGYADALIESLNQLKVTIQSIETDKYSIYQKNNIGNIVDCFLAILNNAERVHIDEVKK